jgi:hypothetical protein
MMSDLLPPSDRDFLESCARSKGLSGDFRRTTPSVIISGVEAPTIDPATESTPIQYCTIGPAIGAFLKCAFVPAVAPEIAGAEPLAPTSPYTVAVAVQTIAERVTASASGSTSGIFGRVFPLRLKTH